MFKSQAHTPHSYSVVVNRVVADMSSIVYANLGYITTIVARQGRKAYWLFCIEASEPVWHRLRCQKRVESYKKIVVGHPADGVTAVK